MYTLYTQKIYKKFAFNSNLFQETIKRKISDVQEYIVIYITLFSINSFLIYLKILLCYS